MSLTNTGTFRGSDSLSLEGQISGSGDLIKTGAGILFVNNTTNSYSGDTWIEEGTLAIADGVLLGQGASLHFDGGTLANTGATNVSPNVAVTKTGKSDVLCTLTLNGDMSGSGELIKKGAGKFVMEGATIYTSTTRVDEGELSGVAESLAGATTVASNSRIAFDQQDSSGTLTGTLARISKGTAP